MSIDPSTRGPRRAFRLAALASLCLAASASALAFTFIVSDVTGLPIKWTSASTVPLQVMLGDTPALIDGTTYNSSFVAATKLWNAQIGAVQFTTTITTGTPKENNRINEVFFAADIFGKAFGDDTIASATYWYADGRKTESDIVFNNQRKYDSYRGNLRSSAGEWNYDLQRVALHELGHSLGLTHPDEAGQSVSAQMNSHTGNTDNLTTDDIQGAQVLYGAPGFVPANDQFANASALTLGASNTVAVQGSTVMATRETGEPTHAGNVGGHSVWYKWTAPGSGGATLTTQGSYFNTLLAVYTGSSLSGLTAIALNDDAEGSKNLSSRVLFFARSGTTYLFAVDGRDGDFGGLSLNLTLDPNLSVAPSIGTQPISLSVTTGNSASFSVGANGSDPLSYQWNFNGTAIAGATSATYTIATTVLTNAGNYSVTVTNPAGSVTSNSASLAVNSPPPPPAPPPSSGGGGGGGAPSLWFVAVLAALGCGRLLQRARR